MYQRNYYKNDPRWITARYPGQCHCGKEIKPGDRTMYSPLGKTVACEECGRVTEAQLADDDAHDFTKAM